MYVCVCVCVCVFVFVVCVCLCLRLCVCVNDYDAACFLLFKLNNQRKRRAHLVLLQHGRKVVRGLGGGGQSVG